MLPKKKLENINNIVIFISDALRLDYLPDEIKKMGLSSVMIASSNCTAPSVSSLVTGLYPFRHGVFTFNDKLDPKMYNILNDNRINTSFRTENTWTTYDSYRLNPIYRMLNQKTSIPLSEIKPPFVYIEDEKGGHCPYGWDNGDIYKEGDCYSFFDDYGKKGNNELIERYIKGINRSQREFIDRINTIYKRGLENQTLIIFMSDHGELLSDYGNLISHGNVTLPELVFVPIVFIHPVLDDSVNESGVVRHVDIVPTLLDILKIHVEQQFDGISLINNTPRKIGINYWKFESKRKIFNNTIKLRYDEMSIWDLNGGYVFKNLKETHFRIIKSLHDTFSKYNIQSHYFKGKYRKNPFKGSINFLKMNYTYWKNFQKFRTPSFSKETGIQTINFIKNKKIQYDQKNNIKSTVMNLTKKGII